MLQAPEHRVRAMTKVRRYSAPFFFNPDYDARISPVVAAGQQAAYRPVVWREFRAARFAGDYSNVGKEIQIEDFKL